MSIGAVIKDRSVVRYLCEELREVFGVRGYGGPRKSRDGGYCGHRGGALHVMLAAARLCRRHGRP